MSGSVWYLSFSKKKIEFKKYPKRKKTKKLKKDKSGKTKNLLIFLMFSLGIIFFLNLIPAAPINDTLHLNLQTTFSNGTIESGTFTFGFNLTESSSASCSGPIVYNHSEQRTTDSRGIVSIYLPTVGSGGGDLSSLNFDTQYYLCYFRDSTLKNVSQLGRVPYSFRATQVNLSEISVDSNLNLTDSFNITANYGFFSNLGSFLSRITSFFTTDADISNNLSVGGNLSVNGRVGIATTSPQSILHIETTTGVNDEGFLFTTDNNARKIAEIIADSGTNGGGIFNLYQGTSTLVTHFSAVDSGVSYINNNGNVGINTSTPQNTLNVVGDLNVTGTIFGGDISANDSQTLDGFDSTFFMPLNTSVFGDFDFNGGWESGGVSITNGDIFAQTIFVYNITSLNVTKQNLTILDNFIVNRNFTVDTNTLFVDSNNNRVGIGTSSPDNPLHVVGNNPIKIERTGIESYTFGISNNGVNDLLLISAVDTTTDIITFESTGNVGIGTTTPQNTLNVIGNGNFTGDLFVDDTITLGLAGVRNGFLNTDESMFVNIDADADSSAQAFEISKDRTGNTGGTVLLRVEEGGNVGINTSTPQNTLNVVGDANITGDLFVGGNNITGDYVPYTGADKNVDLGANNFSVDTSTLFVDSNNNRVGIGVAVPTFALDLRGTQRVLNSGSGIQSLMTLDNAQAAAVDVGGEIRFRGDTGFSGMGGIVAAWEAGDNNDSYLAFKTRGSDVVAERVRIDSSGNVGIGTTTPQTALHIKKADSTEPFIIHRDNAGVAGLGVQLGFRLDHSGGATDGVVAGGIGAEAEGTWTSTSSTRDSSLVFKPILDGSQFEAMRITSAGRMGIGTTSPQSILELSTSSNPELNFRDTGTSGNSTTAGIISFYAEDSASNSDQFVSIQGNVDTFTSGIEVGQINFKTMQAGTLSDAMVIEGGNVGIGTTSPDNPLHIVGNNPLKLDRTGIESYTFGISNNGVNDLLLISAVDTTTDIITFESTGNVGIGTTTPQNTLNIIGDLNVTGTIFGSEGNITDTYVPYTGAIKNVDLGNNNFSVNGTTLFVNINNERVGIGTTSPATTLELASGDLRLADSGDVEWGDGTAFIEGNAASNYIRQIIGNSEKVRLTSTGFGIGIDSPSVELHVRQGGSGTVPTLDGATGVVFQQNDATGRGSHVTIISGTTGLGIINFGDDDDEDRGAIKYDQGTDIFSIRAGATDNRLVINGSSGNVGIGTASPGAGLDVRNDSDSQTAILTRIIQNPTTTEGSADTLNVRGETSAEALSVHQFGTGNIAQFLNDNDAKVTIDNSGNVGIGTTSPTNTLDVIGDINTTGNLKFTIELILTDPTNENWAIGSDATGTGLYFYNVNDGAYRMLIGDDGNVGIGTTSPQVPLHVQGTDSAGAQALTIMALGRDTASSVDDDNYLDFYVNPTDPYARIGMMFPSAGDGELSFWTTTDTQTNLTEQMRIDKDGNVGIGTTSPGSRLHVNSSGQAVILSATSDTSPEYMLFRTSSSTGQGLVGTEGSSAGATITDTLAYASLLASTASGTALQLGSAGSVKMTILSDGNVGIGTTSPNAELHINSSAATNLMLTGGTSSAMEINFGDSGDDNIGIIKYDNNGDYMMFRTNTAEAMRIDSSGNVGIGTTSPDAQLHLNSSVGGILRLTDASASGDGDKIGGIETAIGTGTFFAGINFLRHDTDDGEIRFRQKVANTNTDVMTLVDGFVGIGTTSPSEKLWVADTRANEPTMVIRQSDSGNSYGLYLGINSSNVSFISSTGSGNAALALRTGNTDAIYIDTSANVGIGTTSPLKKLHVEGGSSAGELLIKGESVTQGDGTIFGKLLFRGDSNEQASIEGFYDHATSAFSGLAFFTDGSGGTLERMRIDSSGNVGIGTTAPSDLLTVMGTLNVTDIQLTTNCADGQILKWASGVGTCGTDDDSGGGGGNSSAWNRSGTDVFLANTGDNVGIGTTSPEEKLQIAGGNILIDNNRQYQIEDSVGTNRVIATIDSSDVINFGPTSGAFPLVFRPGASEVMRVTGTNVGIGTTSPGNLLHLWGNSSAEKGLIINNEGTGDSMVRFRLAGLTKFIMGVDNSDSDKFKISPSNFGTDDRFVIDSSGNVGIGTTSPDFILDVQKSNVGSTTDFRIYNLDGTNSASGTRNIVTVNGSGAGDPLLQLNILAVLDWHVGVDNSDSDKFMIGTGSTVGSGNKLTIDQSGNVGIGTTSPAQKLQLGGSSAAVALSLFDSSSTFQYGHIRKDAELLKLGTSDNDGITNIDAFTRMTINLSSGNVGIGTTSPESILNVEAAQPLVTINATTATNFAATQWKNNNDEQFLIGKLNSAGGGLVTTGGLAYAGILHVAANRALQLATNENVRMTIDGSGKVGIGTTSPLHKLDVIGAFISADSETNATNKQAIFLSRQYASATETEGFMMMETFSGANDNRIDIGGGHSSYNAANNITFNTASGVNTRTGTERMRILGNGNVGIGTSNPGHLLTLDGSLSDTAGSGAFTIQNGVTQGFNIRMSSTNQDLNIDRLFSGTWSPVMTFDRSTGNVGIGTTSPDERLHVFSGALSTEGNMIIQHDTYVTNRYTGLSFRLGSNPSKSAILFNSDAADGNGTGDLTFLVDSNNDANDLVVGDEKMRITQEGNVGIGTTSPVSFTPGFEIEGTDPALVLTDSATVVDYLGTNIGSGVVNIWYDDAGKYTINTATAKTGSGLSPKFTIDSNGNVGIGTTSPSFQLHLNSSAGSEIALTATSGTDRTFRILTDESHRLDFFDQTAGVYRISIDSSGNVGIGKNSPGAKLDVSLTASNSEQEFIRLSRTADSLRFNSIYGIVPSSASTPGTISFRVHDGVTTTSQASVMTLKGDGNVGIGTTSPSELLHLESSVSSDPVIQIENTNADAFGSGLNFVKDSASAADADELGIIRFRGDDSVGTETTFADIRGLSTDITDATEDGEIRFRTRAAGTSTETMALVSGNVGIGTTSPSNKLEVNGSIETSGLLDLDASNFFDNTCTTSQGVASIDSTGALSCQTLAVTDTDCAAGSILLGDGSCADNYDGTDDLIGTIAEWQSSCTDCVGTSDLAANSVDLTSDALSTAYAGVGILGGGTAALGFDCSDVDGTGIGCSGEALTITGGTCITADTSGVSVTGNCIDDAQVVDGGLDATSLATNSVAADEFNAGDASLENEVEGMIFDSDAQSITGVWEVQDDVNFQFGTAGEWSINYDDSVDDQLLFTTTKTAAIATTDPMFEILVGASTTTNQQVFGIANGTQASNSIIFTVDIDGDAVFGPTGLGKLDAGATDPIYTIDGIKYATYHPSMIGLKEEVTGTVMLNSDYTIYFKNLEVGSDLWLFYQATDFGGEMENLQVFLTPSFNGKVWYEKNPSENTITIHGTQEGEVSYRLIADRQDWETEWNGNYYVGNTTATGFVLEGK